MKRVELLIARKRALANENLSKAQAYDAEAAELFEEIKDMVELIKQNAELTKQNQALMKENESLKPKIDKKKK